jgi:hypothetical protein
MLIVFKWEEKAIQESIDIIRSMKSVPNLGLINYTLPVGIIKAKHLIVNKSLKFDPDTSVVVVDLSVYAPALGDKNDSGAKLISVEEHNNNCNKIIMELEELGGRLCNTTSQIS